MRPLFNDVSQTHPSIHGRLHELDVLRGIAAIGVLACHYTSELHKLGRLTGDFRLGSYGPHLFFMISGFVIIMTLTRCKRPTDFLFSRFSRLYPVYWVAVLFSTFVLLLFHRPGMPNQPTIVQLLGNLTMCQTWLGIPDIEEPYWTLAVELKFYALMFLLLVTRKLRWIEPCVVSWLSMVVVFRLLDSQVTWLPHALATPLILDYAHLFAAGVMFYRLRTEGGSWLRHTVILLAVPLQFWSEGTESAVLVVLFVAVFYLFVHGRLTWIVSAPLKFLGGISYALYLIHASAGIALIHALSDFGTPVAMLLLAPTLLSLLVASALTYGFEKPCLARMRKWHGRRQTVHASVASEAA